MPGSTVRQPTGPQSCHRPSRCDTKLCNTCSKINLKNAFYSEIRRKTLGLWLEVVQSIDCSLCRLIVSALRRCPGSSGPKDQDEIVVWNAPAWELGIEKSPYDSTKTDSYSNKFDLRSKAKGLGYQPYRVIVEVEGRPELYGVLQRVRHTDSSEREFFGRQIESRAVDIGLLRHWTRRCKRWHGNSCGMDGVAGRGLPHNLRLIDVRRRRVVTVSTSRFDSKSSYLTLSYVWGVEAMRTATGTTPQTLTRSMVRIAENGQEDTPLPDNLPRTIEDAIYLTNQLGYRYIWIDALCIVQDDPIEEKDKSLRRMDAIYNCSALTIVAASGHHADVGIPGIGPKRKECPHTQSISGMLISTMSPSYSDLENSRSLPWNTRGWTFQEKILAKRLLLFTDYQVYFKCAESIWIEEAYMETGELSKSIEARPEKYRWGPDRPQSERFVPTDKTLLLRLAIPQLNIDDPWGYLGKFSDYAAALREYTCRSLSNPEDKLKAIHGVFRTLRSDTGDFINGHPENYFLQSLLWHPVAGSRIVRSDVDLPSWSWAGWETDKGVTYDVLDVRVLRAIMLAMRDLLKRLMRFIGKLFEGGGSSSSSSSADGSNYSSSSGSSSSSSKPSRLSSSSSQRPNALTQWYRSREWSTMKIAGKASGNIAVIFALPLLDRRHTVSELYLCENGYVSSIQCDESLRLNTFLEDDMSSDRGSFDVKPPKMTPRRRHQLERTSLHASGPFLSMRTIVIKLRIGKCLQKPYPEYKDECSIFELLDPLDNCVGEVWTTLEVVQSQPPEGLTFLTISWGLSLSFANIAEEYIPRWTLDAAKLPESQTLKEWRPVIENLFKPPPRKTLAKRYGGEPGDSVSSKSEYTVMSFLDSLFTAKAREPLPKALWSSVNVLLVDVTGQSARRLGVGKVIFGAWLMCAKLNRPEEVILE